MIEKNTKKDAPNPGRYVRQHGTGVTKHGIERAMKLLPAMRAIGHPDQDYGLTAQDLEDVKSCLETYRLEGRLEAAGAVDNLWSDMGVFAGTDMDAVGRLQDQRLPNGSTKYRAAFQAVPLAMEPSRDLAHSGYWHLISDMAGYRNMEAFMDQEAAGKFLATALDASSGAGRDGMASKLAACWKSLDDAAPCLLKGAEESGRMMQFCAVQNLAYLDGYDLFPNDNQARAIGNMVRDGFSDMDGFKKILAASLYEHEQPQAERGVPARPKSAFEKLKEMVGAYDESHGGHGGNGGSSGSTAPYPDMEP